MAIKVVAYKPEHFLRVREASDYFQQLHSLYAFGSPLDVARMYLRGPAWTILNNEDIVVGCGGVMKLWKGVGDAWVLATPFIQKYPKYVTQTVQQKLAEAIQLMRFERVQCVVKQDFEVGHRWIQCLGFKKEGFMEKYFGGMDFVRYSIITRFQEE